MSQAFARTSRILGVLELVLIVVPSFLVGVAALFMADVALLGVNDPIVRASFVVSVIVAPIACACCGVLLVRLIRGSATRLSTGRLVWAGTVAGVLIVLVGVIAQYAEITQSPMFLADFHALSAFGMGVPMLLPALHVFVELSRRPRHLKTR